MVAFCVFVSGSSPRLRGALVHALARTEHLGIIPASAGSTSGYARNTSSRSDYPRVCGEHSRDLALTQQPLGSSPRLRGARRRQDGHLRGAGIIPASAGSTGASAPSCPSGRDHPRVCGEHKLESREQSCMAGSSPRLRGAREGDLGQRHRGGIIPASAGSTQQRSCCTTCTRDHPRVCGEHSMTSRTLDWTVGSSPRLRGALSPRPLPARSPRDHPRVCGEHLGVCSKYQLEVGLSPRLRGAQQGLGADPAAPGIIPASAGSTRRRTRHRRLPWDHPRVCGEHALYRLTAPHTTGSSPRLRGAPRRRPCRAAAPGIIPASAGSTPM